MQALTPFTRPTGALLVAAALVFGVLALVPGTTEAKIRCFCPPTTQEVTGWEMTHTSCAAARSMCAASVQSQAASQCNLQGSSVCAQGNVTYTQFTCNFEGGVFKSDCQLKFACEECFEIDLP